MNEDNIFGCCDLCDNLRPLTRVTNGSRYNQYFCDECAALNREDIDEEDDQLRYFWENRDA